MERLPRLLNTEGAASLLTETPHEGVIIKLPGQSVGKSLKDMSAEEMNVWYREVVKKAFLKTHESSGAKSNLKDNAMFMQVSDTQREIWKRWQNVQKGKLSLSKKERKILREKALAFIADAKPCNVCARVCVRAPSLCLDLDQPQMGMNQCTF